MLVPRLNFHLLKHYVRHWFVSKTNGHGVHSPFAYKLCEEVFYNPNHFYDFDKLDVLRKALLKNKTNLVIEDFGAGSKLMPAANRKVNQIAKQGISSKKQSELLYRLVNFLNCKTVIELGTSIGLNTLYLAMPSPDNNVYTIEGSTELHKFAQTLAIENNITNVRFIHGKFDDELPNLLNQLSGFDLLYVDGNHRYTSTLNYFNVALQKYHNNSLIVFDDIYWSKDMTKVWEEIKNHPSVSLSIDTFYFGLVFFKQEIKTKQHIKLFI